MAAVGMFTCYYGCEDTVAACRFLRIEKNGGF